MLRFYLAILSALLLSSAVRADDIDLLPVDEAYRLTAKAVSRERMEFTWQIAPGYYLYRHRFGVQPVAAASFRANSLQLPPGNKHTDAFFGPVETYHRSVTAILTGTTASNAHAVQFKVKYQGCADIGVCYPPQTRILRVAMPNSVGAMAIATAPTPARPIAMAIAPTTVKTNDPLAALTGDSKSVLNDGNALPEEQAFRVEAIANSASELLIRMSPAPGYYLYRDKTNFQLVGTKETSLGKPRWPTGTPHYDEHFGEVVVYFDSVEIPVPLSRTNTAAHTITLQANFQGCQTSGICYRPMTRMLQVALPTFEQDFTRSQATIDFSGQTIAVSTAPTMHPVNLFFSLLLAIAGGLILNLMPCVLPILSFKALGLAQGGASHSHAKAHAFWYTLGVLVSFSAIGGLVLGLRSAGQALGWGFQLQQPGVVAGLTLLMFAIGLNLSGVFRFGSNFAGTGQSLTEKSGALGDFFTGVLAVVVASPCTAPFMGTALGYAFTAPVVPALLVFLALGLGLALPLLLIGFVPALASRIPKPGQWMETFKQWLAYPMYFTAIWLAWVFGKQRGVDALALLLIVAVLLSLGLWWFERQRHHDSFLKRALAYFLIIMAFGTLILALRIPDSHVAQTATESSVPYSPERLTQLRTEGRPVFVDMTADWCITCKINEKAVLNTAAFQDLLRETGTTYMVGDWTNQDTEISVFLDQFNAPGVPLYVVFPANGEPGRKLPQLLTLDRMRDALQAAENRPEQRRSR